MFCELAYLKLKLIAYCLSFSLLIFMIIAMIICLRCFVVLFICADIYGHGGRHLKVIAVSRLVFTDVLNRIS